MMKLEDLRISFGNFANFGNVLLSARLLQHVRNVFAAPPLDAVGNGCSIHTLINAGRAKPRQVAHGLFRCAHQKVHQLTL